MALINRSAGNRAIIETQRVGFACFLVLLPILGFGTATPAATLVATPVDYRQQLERLRPGDVLSLQPGVYRDGLDIHGLTGRPGAPVIIQGPTSGPAAVLLGRPGRNVVSILDAAHVVIRHLEIDGNGAFVDGVKAEGHARFAHDITLENLHIHNLAQEQQSVGISTKCPAWNWVVRGNRIEGVGTGMYFGDSDGGDAFVGGLVEYNDVIDTIGYNLQVKHQKARPTIEGMPLAPRRTIIRGNRFVKARGASRGNAARPNVLVGHFPPEGSGGHDAYLIHGNLFLQNPGEALFQGEGNVALYDNLFFNSHDTGFPAVAIQPHNDIPRRVRVFANTVVNPGIGIRVLRQEGRWVDDQWVFGNTVVSMLPAPLRGGRRYGNRVLRYRAMPDAGRRD